MTNRIFQFCVDLLVWLAGLLGISYQEINVWIFCVIWPLLTLLLVAVVVWQCFIILKLRRKSSDG